MVKRFCKGCGVSLDAGAAFCHACGTPSGSERRPAAKSTAKPTAKPTGPVCADCSGVTFKTVVERPKFDSGAFLGILGCLLAPFVIGFVVFAFAVNNMLVEETYRVCRQCGKRTHLGSGYNKAGNQLLTVLLVLAFLGVMAIPCILTSGSVGPK